MKQKNDEESRVTAKGTARKAEKFHQAVLALSSRDSIGTYFPVEHYLVAHSIELSLKAILRDAGFAVAKLRSRSLGHNLEALLKEVEKTKRITFDLKEKEIIKAINKMYSNKELEYSLTGANSLPYLKDLLALSTRILEHEEFKKISTHGSAGIF